MEIVASYPEADTIHLVMDNLSSHNRKALVERFGEKIGGLLWERFTVHYTPKHGSWLNQAEIEISLFSRQCLGQRRIPSLDQLQCEARAWNRKMNRDQVTINWQFTQHKKHARSSVTNRKQIHTVRDLGVNNMGAPSPPAGLQITADPPGGLHVTVARAPGLQRSSRRSKL